MSYMEKSTFTSTPEKIFGADGQRYKWKLLQRRLSLWYLPGEETQIHSLHFNTFYQIAGEQLSFFDDLGFERRTVERRCQSPTGFKQFLQLLLKAE